MKTIEVKLFQFDELTEEAKEKAIQDNYDINVNHEWWDGIDSDLYSIEAKLEEFDIDRGSYCTIKFNYGVENTMELILKEHAQIVTGKH